MPSLTIVGSLVLYPYLSCTYISIYFIAYTTNRVNPKFLGSRPGLGPLKLQPRGLALGSPEPHGTTPSEGYINSLGNGPEVCLISPPVLDRLYMRATF